MNNTGERQFKVLVSGSGRMPLAYRKASGEKALQNMATLKSRGLEPVAITTANGITEILSFAEMHELYAEDERVAI